MSEPVKQPRVPCQRIPRYHSAILPSQAAPLAMMSALGVGAPRVATQPVDAQRSMQSTPLYKPLGAQRRPIHTLASHAEAARPLVGNVQLDPAANNFVRPDVPLLSDDEADYARGSKVATLPARVFGSDKSFAANAKFRSALEQVRASIACVSVLHAYGHIEAPLCAGAAFTSMSFTKVCSFCKQAGAVVFHADVAAS